MVKRQQKQKSILYATAYILNILRKRFLVDYHFEEVKDISYSNILRYILTRKLVKSPVKRRIATKQFGKSSYRTCHNITEASNKHTIFQRIFQQFFFTKQ